MRRSLSDEMPDNLLCGAEKVGESLLGSLGEKECKSSLTLSPVTLFLTFSDLFEKFISIDWCKDILRNCG